MTNTQIQASQAAPDLPVRSREEKSSRQVAMEAKFRGPANMAEKQKTKKLSCMTFLCMITLRKKTVAHTFLLSFDNTNVHLCQDRLLTIFEFPIIHSVCPPNFA